MAQDMQDAGNVSAELDAMVCDLIDRKSVV